MTQKDTKYPKTVGDLRDILSYYPNNMRIVVSGYEDGFENPRVFHVKAVMDTNKDKKQDWIGVHSMATDDELDKAVDALVIGR